MDDIKAFYENEAQREVLWGTEREKALAENILPCVPARAASVLDAGCGNGFLLSVIAAQRASRLFGVDISTTRLKDLQRRLPQVQTFESHLDKLPFAAASVDVVIASQVLEHIPDPAASLDELARVGRKLLIITVPYEQEPVKVRCRQCGHEEHLDGHLHRFSERRLRDLCPAAGGWRLAGIRKFHTIYSYNRLTWKFPVSLRRCFDRVLVSASGFVPFLKPNYALCVFEKMPV